MNSEPLSEDKKFIDHLESEANKFQQDGGNSQYFAGGIRYAAQLVRLRDTEDKRQPLGIAHLMRCEAEFKSKDNVPEPDRIAELENQNEALARNLAELQVMYGEAKAKLNAIPEPDSQPDELFEEAEAIMVRKFPPEEYGEDGDLAVIYDILRELRDLAKATR